MRVEFKIGPPDESQSFSVTLDAIPRKNDLVSYASPHGIIIRPVLSVRWHIGRGTWDDQTKAVVSLGKGEAMIPEERLDRVAHAIYTAMRASTMDFTHVLRSSENYDGIRPYERAVFIALAEYAVQASEGKP